MCDVHAARTERFMASKRGRDKAGLKNEENVLIDCSTQWNRRRGKFVSLLIIRMTMFSREARRRGGGWRLGNEILVLYIVFFCFIVVKARTLLFVLNMSCRKAPKKRLLLRKEQQSH